MMFMRPETFAARMQALLDLDYPVLGLDEAVRRLAAGDFPDCATVVTIDDGFYLTYDKALPILADRGLPATLYVTTYYAEKQTPIFHLVVEYMFWKSTRTDFALAELEIPSLIDEDETSAQAQILEYGMQLDEPGRVELCRTLGRCLGVAYEGIEASRQLHLLGGDEVRRAAEMGTDIQLHTRRHRFPRNEAQALRELRENVRDLRQYTTTALDHFCYPRGWYHESQIPWLKLEGIRSATTTDSGFNYAGANPFTLKRFLDSDEFSQIEFEAELSGFTEVLRRGRARVQALLGD